jgi:hypothetical protein
MEIPVYIRERQAGSKTVFEYTPLLIPVLLAATSVYLIWLSVDGSTGLTHADMPAWITALAAFGLFAIAAWLYRRERMIFDTEKRTITWSKWSLREQVGGTISFDNVKHLIVEVTGRDNVLSYRLAIETADERIPLTNRFAGDPDHWEPLAERLRRLVGLSVGDTTNDNARSLIAAGKLADAVRILCDAKGMSVAGATGLVKQLGEPATV